MIINLHLIQILHCLLCFFVGMCMKLKRVCVGKSNKRNVFNNVRDIANSQPPNVVMYNIVCHRNPMCDYAECMLMAVY